MHRSATRPLSLLLSLLALAFAVAPAAAQGTPPADEIFVERVDVNVVNVEVFVTDRDGNRISGLTREDFEVLEDGRPVDITNFYAESWVDALQPEPAPEPGRPALPPPPRREVPPDQRLHLAVFVDHAHADPAGRQRALEQLEGFLEDRLREGDRVMLAEYDRTFKLVEPFTDSLDRLFSGVDRMTKASAPSVLREAQRRQVMTSMTLVAQENNDDAVLIAHGLVRSYVQQEIADLGRAADALQRVIQALAGLPGRRAVLYLGGGLPRRPGEELYQYLQDLFGQRALADAAGNNRTTIDPSSESLGTDQKRVFDRLTELANANQVTLYTLDTFGAAGSSTLGAEHGFASGGIGNAGHTDLDALRDSSLAEPLVELAAATGGTAIVDTANFDDALAAMATDFDTFYSLGYRAPAGGDGRFHKVEVRVLRPGLRVRHRDGYVDRPMVERVGDRTVSSLLLDLESNPLGIAVEFGTPKPGRGRHWNVPILVRVPLRQVTLLPNDDKRQGKLQFYVVVKDGDGGVSELHRHPYPVNVPAAELPANLVRDIGYYVTLEMRPGRPVLAVGVWDELSGTESYIQKQVIVGEGDEPAREEGRGWFRRRKGR